MNHPKCIMCKTNDRKIKNIAKRSGVITYNKTCVEKQCLGDYRSQIVSASRKGSSKNLNHLFR